MIHPVFTIITFSIFLAKSVAIHLAETSEQAAVLSFDIEGRRNAKTTHLHRRDSFSLALDNPV